MSIFFVGFIVLGCLLYVFFVLFSYFEQSSSLTHRLKAIRAQIARKRERFAEYQRRAELLREALPGQHRRRERMERWSALLKSQKAQLESEVRRVEHSGDRDSRDRESAVRQNLSGFWKRRFE